MRLSSGALVNLAKRSVARGIIRETVYSDLAIVCRITEELAFNRQSFDAPVRNVDSLLLIYNNELLNKWKEQFFFSTV